MQARFETVQAVPLLHVSLYLCHRRRRAAGALSDGDEAPAVNNVFTGLPEQDVIAQRFAEAIRLCDELSALAEPRPPKQVKFADEEEQRVRLSHQIM